MLSIYYPWTNILPHWFYFLSDIQCYFEYIIKGDWTVTDNPQ